MYIPISHSIKSTEKWGEQKQPSYKNAMFWWVIVNPGIHVDVTLSQATHLNINADQVQYTPT